MALESVTSSGRQPSWSRSPGSAPDCSSSSTMSKNSQVAAGGRKGRVSVGMLARGGGAGRFWSGGCGWRWPRVCRRQKRRCRRAGLGQRSGHDGSLWICHAEEGEGQNDTNAKPEVLRGCHWCKQRPEPAVQSEVLGAEGSAGTQREPGHSLAKAHSRPGLETDRGKGPRVLLQHCRDPQSATWESIPCLLLYPEFIMHSPSVMDL